MSGIRLYSFREGDRSGYLANYLAVVLRFDERVGINRLVEVVVSLDFTEKVIAKVGLLGRYIEAHLHSDAFGAAKPISDDLKNEIDVFVALKKELKKIREKIFAD